MAEDKWKKTENFFFKSANNREVLVINKSG